MDADQQPFGLLGGVPRNGAHLYARSFGSRAPGAIFQGRISLIEVEFVGLIGPWLKLIKAVVFPSNIAFSPWCGRRVADWAVIRIVFIAIERRVGAWQ